MPILRPQDEMYMMQTPRTYNPQMPAPTPAPTPTSSSALIPSILDRFSLKRREVLKLLTFAFVIVIALGIHSVCDVFLKRYISGNDFPESKEYLIRAAYPVLAFAVMWSLKVFYK
jgi:hypothetical protein